MPAAFFPPPPPARACLYPTPRCSLEGNVEALGARKRGRRAPRKVSGPLPPALLTNAFANPLEVCAAGEIIMIPSRPLLQRTSLCCAKMPVSVLDDGGEVMAIAPLLSRVGSPRRLLGANIAPLVAEKRRPRRRWKYGAAGAVKRGRSEAMRHAVVLRPSLVVPLG